jgi:hypothetical protein
VTKVGEPRRTSRLLPRPSPLHILLGFGLFMAGWIVLGTSNAQAATDRGVSEFERTSTAGSPAVSHQNSSHKPPSGAGPATTRTAGGADASVDAGGIGSDEARDEGIESSISWPGRVSGERTKVMSAHIGREREDAVGRNVSNVHTPQYECKDVKEDEPSGPQGSNGMLARIGGGNPLGSDGYVGRVVQDATTAAGDSVPSVWQAAYTVRQVGEPALGVMGGLIQLVSSPAERVPGLGSRSGSALESPRVMSGSSLPSITARSETAAPYSLPPVSSFPAPSLNRTESGSTGSSENPAKTTPAPNSIPEQSGYPAGAQCAIGERIAKERGPDVTSGDVSPLTVTATAGTDVAPTGRESIEIHRTHRPGVSPD